ncbi:MAG: hypothetical protein IPH09_04935 [bacterium]|nr:hypothetical protein [bacterium]
MIPRLPPAGSLRTRILLTTGATITVIMMVVSWGILVQWRQTVLAKERSYAHAVARAFSVTALEALISEANELAPAEGFLDGYIADFMRQNPRLRFIAVFGPDGGQVARSVDGPRALAAPPLPPADAAADPASWFRRHDGPGWLLETGLPLTTGRKCWGSVALGFEAESVRRELSRIFFLLLGLVVAITGAMLLVLWVLLDRLLRSLRDLVGAMDALELAGDGPPDLPARDDEIGVLFRHFQEMGRRLGRSRRELISAQEQVYHAERLAAAGRLAAGVAHEINNPINGVRHCIYAIRSDPDNREQTLAYLQMMDEGMEQAASIVKKLLGFARKQAPAREAVDLNAAVASVTRLLSFDLERRGVELRLDLQPDLPAITGDAQLLQEVLMNLLLNAADAADGSGAVQLTTRAGGDGRVRIEVADRGQGIAAQDLPRIFDPFFTTKATGEGTGLGLSISLGIVEAHGGAIDVVSEPGAGTTFTVTLPAEATP